MIITLSGSAGSGKSTVGKLLAKRLKFNHYSMGDLRRKMAAERGMTLAEFNKLGESEDFTDRDADMYQKKLGEQEDNFVIDGRLAFHFIPHSIKLFLDADELVRAQRIFGDERDTERFASLDEAKQEIANRQASDVLRYKKYYNLDCLDTTQYDYVVDTTQKSPDEIVEYIIELLRKHEQIVTA